jgi:hypothetical protein
MMDISSIIDATLACVQMVAVLGGCSSGGNLGIVEPIHHRVHFHVSRQRFELW